MLARTFAVGAPVVKLLGVTTLLLTAAPVAAEVRVVAVVGELAPASTRAFQSVEPPKLSGGGEVAFAATLAPGVGNPTSTRGIWSEGDGLGLLRNVALIGGAAPGGGGATFLDFEQTEKNLYLNDLGDVAFLARLNDQTIGLWTDRERPGAQLTKIARGGDVAPATADPRHFQSSFSFHGFGEIHSGAAFLNILTVEAAPNNFPSTGVFNEGFSVVLNKVAQTAAETSPNGGVFTTVFAPTINDAGHVAFTGAINLPNRSGVWTTSPGGVLRKVALTSENAPGTATTFSTLFREAAVLNHAGDVAFVATLNGLVNGGLREGVWVERDGVVQKVVFESENAPGTATTFDSLGDALIDEEGRAAFHAQLQDGRDGLWRETSPGVLAPVAIQGQAAPGTSLSFLNIRDMAVNRSGQVAFAAQLSDSSSDGIFATDAAGKLHKVVAKGDQIDVRGEEFTVQVVDFVGINHAIDAAGLSSGFNDAGQVAFFANLAPTQNFPDGLNGIFVAEPPNDDSANFDEDNDVDGNDFLTWQRGLGIGSTLAEGDANDDHSVDADDLAVWKDQFGKPTTAVVNSTIVPEPSGSIIAATLLLCVTGRFRGCSPRGKVRLT